MYNMYVVLFFCHRHDLSILFSNCHFKTYKYTHAHARAQCTRTHYTCAHTTVKEIIHRGIQIQEFLCIYPFSDMINAVDIVFILEK